MPSHSNRFVLTVVLLLILSIAASAQNATVQVLHNSADPLLSAVDIYVDNTLVIDDMPFRSASSRIEVPGGTSVQLAIAPLSSSSVLDALHTQTLSVESDKTYFVVVSGVIDTTQFAPNPESSSRSIKLAFIVVGEARTSSLDPETVDVMFINGVTDSPLIDVYLNITNAFGGIAYGTATEYQTVNAETNILGVAPSGQSPVSAFRANLTNAKGRAVTVISSGFLNPSANQGGAVFGMFIVPRFQGAFQMLFPTAPLLGAQVQLIHNSADASVSDIDIYLGAVKVVDDLKFRNATQFLDLPNDSPLNLGIAPASSTSSAEVFHQQELTFGTGRYVLMLRGVQDTTKFVANPDSRAPSIALTISRIDNIRPNASSQSNVDIMFVHSTTDLGAVDFNVNATTNVVQDAVYGSASEYEELVADKYLFTLQHSGGATFGSYYANLVPFAGQSIIVTPSGFFDSTANNGSGLHLYGALSSGGQLVEFVHGTSSVKEVVVHNVKFFPQPADDVLNIEFTNNTSQPMTIAIYSVEGKLISTFDVGNNNIGLVRKSACTEALVPGAYYVVFSTGSMHNPFPLFVMH